MFSRSSHPSTSHLSPSQSPHAQDLNISVRTAVHNASTSSETRQGNASSPAADGPAASSQVYEYWMHDRSRNPSPFVVPQSLPVTSESGMILVTDYTPTEGEGNVPISVNVEMRGVENEKNFGSKASLTGMKLRLIFGRTAVKTVVNRLAYADGDSTSGEEDVLRLRLYANTPDHAECRFDDLKVPLAIQAMDSQTSAVETVVFGSFHYWSPSMQSFYHDAPSP